MLSLFPRDILDEILDLIESVSESFSTYSFIKNRKQNKKHKMHDLLLYQAYVLLLHFLSYKILVSLSSKTIS